MTMVSRTLLVVAPLLAGSGAAGAWFAWSRGDGPVVPAISAARPLSPQLSEAAPRRGELAETGGANLARLASPRFDVARVGARGAVVAAGRAMPGAEVLLLVDGSREIGRSRADARGDWVILPEDPAQPGARELSLRARLPDGQEMVGTDTVVVVVPNAPLLPGAALPGSGRPSGEGGAPPLVPPPPPPRAVDIAPRALGGVPGASRLGVDIVDYDAEGSVRFAGTAPPGAELRFYADDRRLGGARSGEDGRWSFSPPQPPAPGRHRLRVDQGSPGAASFAVSSRVEVAFQREEAGAAVPRDGRVVVQPGHNLWRIARETYGRGARFTLIFAANREQIRDPRRIYPGQLLGLPEAPDDPTTSSSRAR